MALDRTFASSPSPMCGTYIPNTSPNSEPAKCSSVESLGWRFSVYHLLKRWTDLNWRNESSLTSGFGCVWGLQYKRLHLLDSTWKKAHSLSQQPKRLKPITPSRSSPRTTTSYASRRTTMPKNWGSVDAGFVRYLRSTGSDVVWCEDSAVDADMLDEVSRDQSFHAPHKPAVVVCTKAQVSLMM